MKLYKATFTFDVLVAADDLASARNIAEDNAAGELADNMQIADAFAGIAEVVNHGQIPPTWRGAIPYREDGDDETRCLVVLDAIIAARPVGDAPGQGKLFEEPPSPPATREWTPPTTTARVGSGQMNGGLRDE